jgi:glycosyltransferase involved in cell wall biosynthesis
MGRLLRWKGFETLIDAVADLRSEVPGVSMAIVGSGPDAASLRRKVRQAGLEKTIRLVEALPRPESLTYLKAADLFVLNSAAEGMSHTIVEAMALGTPVVATDAGGTRELIDHGRSGWLVRHDAREDFGSAICALLSDPERAARMAEAAKRTVEAYSTDTMLRATVAALQDAR